MIPSRRRSRSGEAKPAKDPLGSFRAKYQAILCSQIGHCCLVRPCNLSDVVHPWRRRRLGRDEFREVLGAASPDGNPVRSPHVGRTWSLLPKGRRSGHGKLYLDGAHLVIHEPQRIHQVKMRTKELFHDPVRWCDKEVHSIKICTLPHLSLDHFNVSSASLVQLPSR